MRLFPTVVLSLALTSSAFAHGRAGTPPENEARRITFPNTETYQVLVVDPHTHSVFSDGHVWPRIRVGEALRDGLDGLAITEHLEYQPHLADIPHADRNRAYLDAAAAAEGHDLLVIPGAEITRNAPASHQNALFITDANELLKVDDPYEPEGFYDRANEWSPQEAVQAANDQGAFVFWNHSWWTPHFKDGITKMPEFHANNAKAGLLHGIEVANGGSYSAEAFQIALDYDLAVIGVSDIHGLIDWSYDVHDGGHRPVTLVLAEERSMESMKEAMFARRTVAWFQNLLIGRAEHIAPLLQASLTIGDASYGDGEILRVTLTNHSDVDFRLRNRTKYTFSGHTDMVDVPQHESVTLRVKTGSKVERIELEFEVLNALTAPKQTASLTLAAGVEAAE
jgi:hypothetical protein